MQIDVLSLTAIIISVCALFVTIFQSRQIVKHNKLSVTPHLTFDSFVDEDEGTISLSISNTGVGPAIISEFILKDDGKKLPVLAAQLGQILFQNLTLITLI